MSIYSLVYKLRHNNISFLGGENKFIKFTKWVWLMYEKIASLWTRLSLLQKSASGHNDTVCCFFRKNSLTVQIYVLAEPPLSPQGYNGGNNLNTPMKELITSTMTEDCTRYLLKRLSTTFNVNFLYSFLILYSITTNRLEKIVTANIG